MNSAFKEEKVEFCSVPCMNTPTLFTPFFISQTFSSFSQLTSFVALSPNFWTICPLRGVLLFNVSICERFLSFVFVCVWPSGLTPTFNSCGKCSQTFHFQVPLSFPTPTLPLSVSMLAFLSPPSVFLFSLCVSYTHMQAHDAHTSGLIFIASSSFTWHGSLNRCAPALSLLSLSLCISAASCSTDLPYLLAWKKAKLTFNLDFYS